MHPIGHSAADIVISNPKLSTETAVTQGARIFPYYAGYSAIFAQKVLSSLPLEPGSVVFDPWNGSGTTTQVAHRLGHKAFGTDLNPVMVIAAKAAMLSPLEYPSLGSISKSLIETCSFEEAPSEDPLTLWLSPSSAASVRSIECAINRTFVCKDRYLKLNTNEALAKVSPLAAFFYVALFRATRRLLADFIPSNPTWIKKPQNPHNRKRPQRNKIIADFIAEVENLAKTTTMSEALNCENNRQAVLQIGNAENISLSDKFVDAIISSPPYCTRIDYAVSTSIELSLMRFDSKEFDELRRSLTGTSTVGHGKTPIDPLWGSKCLKFLEELHSHPSRASKGYYYKNHLQYFKSLFGSIAEISRVLKPDAYFVLVSQDSHYKEIHNDVPGITAEMAAAHRLELIRRLEFPSTRSMVGINGRSRKYLNSRKTTESVLVFRRS